MKINDIKNSVNVFNDISIDNIEKYISIAENKNGKYFFNLMDSVHIPSDMNPVYYSYYYPTEGETFEMISYRVYGTIKLWWVICTVNKIFDMTSGAKAGSKLKIPKKQIVQNILLDLLND